MTEPTALYPRHEPRPPVPSSGTYRLDGDVLATLPSELLELLQPPAWHADAACREHPDVNFFPERGETAAEAKEICAGCLVRDECLAVGLGEYFGIWAGTAEYERKHLRRAGPPRPVRRTRVVETRRRAARPA